MNNTVRQVFRVQSAMGCNRFLFWVKKIPLIKHIFPDGFYGAWEAKQYLMVLVEILKTVYAFAGKFLYLALACVLPLFLSYEGGEVFARGWPMFLNILVFMSFFVGCFLQSSILTASFIKYTCVRQLSMNARACVLATTGREQVTVFITFTTALLVAAAVFGQPVWFGLLVSLELAATRAIAEFLQVLLYRKTGKIPSKNVWFIMMVVLLGMALAYIPVAAEIPLPMDRFLLNPAVAIALLGCGVLSVVWLLRYPSYRALVADTCKPENISTAAAKQNAAQAAFKDVQMKTADLSMGDAGGRIAALKGYAYLNAVFFRRHRRMLTKPMKYVLIGVGLLLAAGTLGALFAPEFTGHLVAALPGGLPAMVFVMYVICNTIGARICKAMFYNCDISLLRFGWYRERSVVLQNFALRLRKITGLNLLLAGGLCLAIVVPAILSGAAIALSELVFLLLSILFLAIFFSVHPLFMYYVFQPYTSQLAVKNPFFSAINGVVYMVSFLCLQIKQPPEGFAFIVLAATLAYCVTALLVVWKRAPKTFRVK